MESAMSRSGSDPQVAGAEVPKQADLMQEAFGFAAEHRFYLRKAVEQADLESALRHALCLANELRSSQLTPSNYYKLYALVFWELQHLASFVQDTEAHGRTLEEVYEIVQYEGNALPRLYMLVTVGMLRMQKVGDVPPDDILEDLSSMLDAVQEPIRGLFLRYYLLQVVKEKLHCLQSGISGAMKFFLINFKASASLWQRLRLEGKRALSSSVAKEEVQVQQEWQLDDRRHALRLLVGSHLMQIARLDGLTVELYAKVVLPDVLRQITLCEDPPGQAYLLQSFIEVFPDDFHIHTLDRVLAVCAQVHWAVDLQPLLQRLLRRLTARLAGGNAKSAASFVDAFGLFHAHLNELHGRPRTVATPLASLLALQLELCMSALALHPGDAGHLEVVLHGTVKLLDGQGPGPDCDPLDADLVEAVVDIIAAPLTQERVVPELLAMPYHEALMASIGQSGQRRAALAMVTAMLDGDVSLSDCQTLRRLLSLADTLLRDEGHDATGKEALARHLEHDPSAFTAEQEAVARLVHQVRHKDPNTVFRMLSELRDCFFKGGPHRIVFTLPAMVVAMLRLVSRMSHGEGQYNLHEECVSILEVLQCTHDMCEKLRTHAPQECLRLWLLCAASADRAASMGSSSERLVEVCSSFVDGALTCLENNVKGETARLCGLQLLVATVRQLSEGVQENQMLWERTVAFSYQLPTKRSQSKGLCLCSELFWFPRGKAQDPQRGLLCLRRALQCADSAVHINPLDVDLFVDILNQVAHLFENKSDEVLASYVTQIVSLCVQHVSYITERLPAETFRALHAVLADLHSKQTAAMEGTAANTSVDSPSYLDIDLRAAEMLNGGSKILRAG
mmetsp:Transcript_84420/g.149339  ORF Transcript_84420/g.149339 Transcript_84420/m.149339 type:complete len:848 (-) Transcript_84420:44-2587(-)